MGNYVIAKYIRLSVEDEKTESLSIPSQRRIIERHIESLEYPYIETLEFVDNGYSGVSFERPAMNELLDLVRAKKVDCIIVKDFSRFGRNTIDTGYFLEVVFPLFDTRFISVSDEYDSRDYQGATGGMGTAVQFILNEFYSHDLSNKIRSSKYEKMKRGEYLHTTCLYGYRKGNNGRLEIDEEASVVVQLIYELAASGHKKKDITKALHEKMIPTPTEYRNAQGHSTGIWSNRTLYTILSDERYTGTYVAGKMVTTEVGSGKMRLRPENEWYKILDNHPAIVSRETFELVQAKKRRGTGNNRVARDYTLRSKVACGCCGFNLKYLTYNEPAFACYHTKAIESADCYGLQIGEKEIEEILLEVIKKQAGIVLGLDGLSDVSETGVKSEQQDDYEKRLEERREKKQMLYERFVLKELDANSYKKEKAVIDREVEQLNHAFSMTKLELRALAASKSYDDELRNLVDVALESDRLTRSIVELLVDKVYVFPDYHIEIVWKFAEFGAININR